MSVPTKVERDAVERAKEERNDAEEKLQKKDDEIKALGEKIDGYARRTLPGLKELSKEDIDELKDIAKRSLDDLLAEKPGLIAARDRAQAQLEEAQDDLKAKKAGYVERALSGLAIKDFDDFFKATIRYEGKTIQFVTSYFGQNAKIFIRECFGKYYGYVKEIWSLSEKTNVFLTGSPGIGKSAFGLYMLKRLYEELSRGSEEFNLVYGEDINSLLKFERDGKVFNVNHNILLSPTTYAILDSPVPETCKSFRAKTLVISSPQTRKGDFGKSAYDDYHKQNCRIIFMDLWTSPEIDQLLEAVRPRVVLKGPDREDFYEIPRAHYSENYCRQQRDRLQSRSEKFQNYLNGDVSWYGVPHSIFKIRPSLEDELPTNYTLEPFNQPILAKQIGKREDLDSGTLRANFSNSSSSTKRMAFEIFVHQYMVTDCDSPRSLWPKSKSGKHVFVKSGSKNCTFTNSKYFSSWDEVDLKPGVYNIPLDRSFSQIDSFGQSLEGDFILFQVTVGEEHSFKSETIEDKIRTIRQTCEESKIPCADSFSFVWVIPYSNIETFQPGWKKILKASTLSHFGLLIF